MDDFCCNLEPLGDFLKLVTKFFSGSNVCYWSGMATPSDRFLSAGDSPVCSCDGRKVGDRNTSRLSSIFSWKLESRFVHPRILCFAGYRLLGPEVLATLALASLDAEGDLALIL